eukprot:Nitzschia sp. Nitz4//scaffold3_size479765//34169//37870//NITZ4_000014-RA/size479765-processed-gene-0.238-mRNA-1//1//CDS//3329550500//5130//frame0
MIVTFVVDTSPSMRQTLSDVEGTTRSKNGGSMSRLDLAKMAVESIVRGLGKRVSEHNAYLQQHPELHQSLRNIGLGFSPNDQFLLLSTGRQFRQQPATAACGAGGRLLVGFGDQSQSQAAVNQSDQQILHHSNVDSFQKQLKRLQATDWDPGTTGPNQKPKPFPEDGGGIVGLNTAISVGLRMMSRYRLTYRSTENYGMGRLPSPAVLNPSGGPATHALQPACLIILTDGACLRNQPNEGGGSLELQHGNMPLREFYQEPFRWDQRVFCIGVGGKDRETSTQFFHPQLRALCEVTGGSHLMLRSSGSLGQCTDLLVKRISPPRIRDLPIEDPLRIQARPTPLVGAIGSFALENDFEVSQVPPKYRAMLLYVPREETGSQPSTTNADNSFQSPTWCIPETFFPNAKLDTLPPRSAQPNLHFSKFPTRLGSKSFEPMQLMKMLHRLDQLVLANRKNTSQLARQSQPSSVLLNRDVYVCEWVSSDGKPAKGPAMPMNTEYFPVVVAGAARPSISDGGGNFLNIGILHVPTGTNTLASSLTSGALVSTLTLLPPEPQVLIPLLIKAAEAEHRALKKVSTTEGKDGVPSASLAKKQALASRNVHMDENWRNEFRAYMFQVPPYYQGALRKSLRSVLPSSTHSLLHADGTEGALVTQCFSKNCLQKIRNAEQACRDNNERLERQEAELRRRGTVNVESPARVAQLPQGRSSGDTGNDNTANSPIIGYGQYDPRSSCDSYLATLRNMPAPWRVGGGKRKGSTSCSSMKTENGSGVDMGECSTVKALGDLPGNCLMAYYESRRRWIFGGSGISTRGIFVDGVPNDGSNVQRCGPAQTHDEDSLLSLAGVGVSQLNATTTAKMGDYRERLLWSRAPVVGYGSNDCTGVSATTAINGAPVWSVEDEAMPIAFFNPRTGEFADSVQARVRSRLMVNFGNPYRDKRADSLIPEKFLNQSPSYNKNDRSINDDISPMTPPGSPPHDSYSSPEGEGEAVFAIPVSRIRKSPSRAESVPISEPLPKKQRISPDIQKETVKVEGHIVRTDLEREGSNSLPAAPALHNESTTTAGTPKPQPPVPPAPPASKNAPPPPVPASTPMPPPIPSGGSGKPPPPVPKGVPSKPQRPTAKLVPPAPPPVARRPSGLIKPPAPPSRPQGSQPVPNSAPNKPPPPPAANVAKKAAPPPPPPTIDMQNPNVKPVVDLPPGWMTVWSKSQKRWYFFSTKTNKSVWQWPPP